jgi:hypothetical protein
MEQMMELMLAKMDFFRENIEADQEKMAHSAYVDSVEQHISREAAHAFTNGVRKRDLRQQLLLGTRGH